VVGLIIGVFIIPLASREAPGWGTQPVVTAVTTLATSALPLCIGVAVLKYRLYELNRIISRVVSYTPFRTPVAVAAATLVIAALSPSSSRITANGRSTPAGGRDGSPGTATAPGPGTSHFSMKSKSSRR
jgi:hypothetical protein